MRRMGRYNLSGALAAERRQDQRALRTHPTRRPREDIFLPKQNALISLTAVFPAFSAAASGNRRNRGAVLLAPPELVTIDPHPVQNDSQTPGDRDDSLDASRVAGPLARPMPSATTILRCE